MEAQLSLGVQSSTCRRCPEAGSTASQRTFPPLVRRGSDMLCMVADAASAASPRNIASGPDRRPSEQPPARVARIAGPRGGGHPNAKYSLGFWSFSGFLGTLILDRAIGAIPNSAYGRVTPPTRSTAPGAG